MAYPVADVFELSQADPHSKTSWVLEYFVQGLSPSPGTDTQRCSHPTGVAIIRMDLGMTRSIAYLGQTRGTWYRAPVLLRRVPMYTIHADQTVCECDIW